MERCTLCGGRLVDGRCTECGLDNTKNDKKYHLNIHNEKTTMFHRGRCEDNVNRPHDRGPRAGAGRVQESGSRADAGRVRESGSRAEGARDAAADSGEVSDWQKRQKELKKRSRTGTVSSGGVRRAAIVIFILCVVFVILGIVSSLLSEFRSRVRVAPPDGFSQWEDIFDPEFSDLRFPGEQDDWIREYFGQ